MKKKNSSEFNKLVYMSMGVLLLIIMDTSLYSAGGWPPARIFMTFVQIIMVVMIISGLFKISKEKKDNPR